jgi:hypothetical protein
MTTTDKATAKYFCVVAMNGNPNIRKEAYFASVRAMDAWTDAWLVKGYELYYCQVVPLTL